MVRIECEDEEGERRSIVFQGACALEYGPLLDRTMLFVDGVYQRTVVGWSESPWLAKTLRALLEDGKAPEILNHYLMPSDDGVWQVIARACALSKE
jgi:hypothetical protein